MPLRVVKIGGNVLDDEQALESFLSDFAQLEGPKILVHGGGKLATQMAEQLGIPQTMIEGRRITDEATLRVAVMVYGGWINKRVTAGLQAAGCNALGLTGADGNVLRAVKRPVGAVDYGWVGDVDPSGVNAVWLSNLLKDGVTPVFAALTHDGQGHLLNTNADTIASTLAVAMSQRMPTELLLCFEKKGVLRDVNDPDSLIPRIAKAEWQTLKESGAIHSGMLPKLENAFRAIEQGVQAVRILWSKEVALAGAGTEIVET